ncbi:uncharacterized protein LOC142229333 [Haematobia irritans]|uniref:uncharacterized protein LOC142229333 n=1 Tax=Haematobia irritans TaxID=7368 RepID=UPI003F505079
MGNLPTDRVRSVHPFLVAGVDFCGPVDLTLKIRGRPPTKMYIAIFVCREAWAPQQDLLRQCDELRRCQQELKDLQEEFLANRGTVEEYAAALNMHFNCIPPRAPHFGGYKQAKYLLLRIVGKALLTQEEMTTMLTEVEAVLNSRAIAPLSQDPNDEMM